MRSFRLEPFLWIHAAGLVACPIFLGLCWLGLAVGDPLLPVWLELLFVAVVGITPILWMQWQRPFYIFSVMALAMKPEQLTLKQRQILSFFKTPGNRVAGVLVAVVAVAILWQLYQAAPIAAEVTPFPPEWRIVGLIFAGLSFLASNLFLQVPVSVFRVVLTNDSKFAATEPYPLEQIRQNFSIPGIRVNQILPAIETDAEPVVDAAIAASPSSAVASSAGVVEVENPTPPDHTATE